MYLSDYQTSIFNITYLIENFQVLVLPCQLKDKTGLFFYDLKFKSELLKTI